jgi:hypothetical protein
MGYVCRSADAGLNVHVYVLDTGVRYSHVDFTGRTGPGYDFVDNDDNPDDCTPSPAAAGAQLGFVSLSGAQGTSRVSNQTHCLDSLSPARPKREPGSAAEPRGRCGTLYLRPRARHALRGLRGRHHPRRGEERHHPRRARAVVHRRRLVGRRHRRHQLRQGPEDRPPGLAHCGAYPLRRCTFLCRPTSTNW